MVADGYSLCVEVAPMSELIIRRLNEHNPEAMLLEPREVYDAALVDITDEPNDHWPRKERTFVAVYDSDKCIDAIIDWFQVGYEEATEWFSVNTSGAWVGEGTPTFR